MANYVPILKAKPGEFKAWRTTGPAVRAASRVLFEIVPAKGIDDDLAETVRQMGVSWPTGEIASMDVGYLDETVTIDTTADHAVMWTARQLHDRGVGERPPFRPGDSPAVLAEVADAVALHGHGACLRLGSAEADPVDDVEDVDDAHR